MSKTTITGPVVVKLSDDGKVHVSYIPKTTQVLRAGVEYEFIFEGATLETAAKERKSD